MAKRREKRSNRTSRAGRKNWLPRFSLPSSWFKAPSRPAIGRALNVAAWLVFVGALVTAWVMGVPKLQALTFKQRRVDPHDVVVRFTNQPVWVRGDLTDTLLRTAQANV